MTFFYMIKKDQDGKLARCAISDKQENLSIDHPNGCYFDICDGSWSDEKIIKSMTKGIMNNEGTVLMSFQKVEK